MRNALRRSVAALVVVVACAVPLAACDSKAPEPAPDRADLRSKGCC